MEQVAGGIGFPMPWFGGSVSDLWVSSEGHLSFGTLAATAVITNADMPSTTAPNDIVAVFWDSLGESATGAGQVRTELRNVGPRRVRIVQWTSFNDAGATPGLLTFQAQLWDNGDIVTMVRDSSTTSTAANAAAIYRGSSATFGLENASATEAAIYSYNKDNAIYPGRAILYKKK